MKELLLQEINKKIELGTPTYYVRTPKEYMMKDLPHTLDAIATEIILNMIDNQSADLHQFVNEYAESVAWLNDQIPYLMNVMKTYIEIENSTDSYEVRRIARWEYSYLNEMIQYYTFLREIMGILKTKPQEFYEEIIKDIHKNPKKYRKRTEVTDNFKKITKDILKNVK